MPLVFDFVSAAREAFGVDVSKAVQAGMDGQPTFYAKENGVEVGAQMPAPGLSVSGLALVGDMEARRHPRAREDQ